MNEEEDIDVTLQSYKEQLKDRIAEFQPLLDDSMSENYFELIAYIKVIIENLHEHLATTIAALACKGKRKRGLVQQLLDMDRLDLVNWRTCTEI